MTKPSITQSQKRYQESVGALFTEASAARARCLFLLSSTDQGVIRNGGRNGAKYAPRALLSVLKRMTQTSDHAGRVLVESEVANEVLELEDFAAAQAAEAKRIAQLLATQPTANVCHIGGGHDHIFPLLTAYASSYQSITVINVDAHADTRTDEAAHSGTPFRQFADAFSGEFHLVQLGLHPYANSRSTLSSLKRGSETRLWRTELTPENLDRLFSGISVRLSAGPALVIFSLDADALSGFHVPGVSAVNPNGLSLEELREIWKRYKVLERKTPEVLGIYELNPVYDTVSSLSMRTLAGFIFESVL